jgi:hypothetical protein
VILHILLHDTVKGIFKERGDFGIQRARDCYVFCFSALAETDWAGEDVLFYVLLLMISNVLLSPRIGADPHANS